jgi:hypothetical protein
MRGLVTSMLNGKCFYISNGLDRQKIKELVKWQNISIGSSKILRRHSIVVEL